MNEVPWISIDGLKLPLHEIPREIPDNIKPNGSKALMFCKKWLEGNEAFNITTSGSTGAPKKVTVRRQSMLASAQRTAEALKLRPGMTALVCLDTGFIAGMMMLVRGLTTGMNMIVTEPSANPLRNLASAKIDFAALVPYQMNAMLNSEQREQLALIGTIILGGAAINADLHRAISNIPAACYATFGMTETLSHIALQRLNGVQRQENFHVLKGILISADERGCLVINADYLDKPIVTNDIVEIIRPGEFKWIGRWDNLINSGGIKVVPEKIEKIVAEWMLQKSLQNRFFVTGRAHQEFGQQVVLVIEGKISQEQKEDMMRALAQAVTRYELPKDVVFVDQFKETATGKIDRSASLHPDAMDL
jgi:O-succinylbenzoic acid--CoA ligase